MASIGTTTRPAYVYDAETDTWIPVGNGPHVHAQSDVTGLSTSLEGKAAAVHTHAIADTTGLQTALNAKSDALITAKIIAQSPNYTLILSDANMLIDTGRSAASAVTVPANSSVAFPIGTQIHVMSNNTGIVTLTPGVGVTINATPGLKLRAQWSTATLIKRATDTWLAIGDLSA